MISHNLDIFQMQNCFLVILHSFLTTYTLGVFLDCFKKINKFMTKFMKNRLICIIEKWII